MLPQKALVSERRRHQVEWSHQDDVYIRPTCYGSVNAVNEHSWSTQEHGEYIRKKEKARLKGALTATHTPSVARKQGNCYVTLNVLSKLNILAT